MMLAGNELVMYVFLNAILLLGGCDYTDHVFVQ